MSIWLDKYTHDEIASRLATDAATLHREVVEKTAPRGEPNGLRTAISFMLLEQILHVMGHSFPKLLPLTEMVRDDVMNAVYVSPDTDVDLRTSFFVLDDPTDPAQQKALIDRYYKKTYFQCLREVATKLNLKTFTFESVEKTKDKQMRILNRIVEYWQQYTKRLVLKSWRGYLKGRRLKRQVLGQCLLLRQQLDQANTAASTMSAERDKLHGVAFGRAEHEEELRRVRGQLAEARDSQSRFASRAASLLADWKREDVKQLLVELASCR
jgi:hypothetical protein